jgi:hypothetical protein
MNEGARGGNTLLEGAAADAAMGALTAGSLELVKNEGSAVAGMKRSNINERWRNI